MMALNSTRDFHLKTHIDLMKEYTINESLSSADSPYMRCLSNPRPFGQIVADKLKSLEIIKDGSYILEAGGGYGTLMSGFLDFSGNMIEKAVLADLSKELLLRQKKQLEKWRGKCLFVHADIHEMIGAINGIDLIIMNEMIGDLDTITGLNASNLSGEAAEIVEKYGLEIPDDSDFNLNSGAIRAVETICKKGIPAFISEHSSDPIIPIDMPWLANGLACDSYPREIKLFAHSEFTIRFSHLEKVAKKLGRQTLTGSYIELAGIKNPPSFKFIFTTGACSTQEQEIIYEFLDHIREYRWLIIL